jgi:Glutamate synthase domain 2
MDNYCKTCERSTDGWEKIVILPAQLACRRLDESTKVNLKTVIGRKTRQPIAFNSPIINPRKQFLEYIPNVTNLTNEDLLKANAVEVVISQAAPKGIGSEWDLLVLVQQLREKTNGKPIGIKIIAGKIEEDLSWVKKSTADFVTIDDDNKVGIPAYYALYRARKFIKENEMENVDLILSGGLKTASDFIKAIAIGADAIVVPDKDGEVSDELATFVRMFGKDDIHEISSADLATISEEISKFTDIKHA